MEAGASAGGVAADRIEVRDERPSDHAAVRSLHRAAFEGPGEASLVDALREDARPVLSLVAERGHTVVGHILFSPVTVDGQPDLRLMALAPMAVAPDVQRRGVGSLLIRAGWDACLTSPCAGVVVLGHPTYYPRFGFEPASRFGLSCPYDVPDEVFLARETAPGALASVEGTVRYHKAFDSLASD